MEHQLAPSFFGATVTVVPQSGTANLQIIQRIQHQFACQRRVTAPGGAFTKQADLPVIKITYLPHADPGALGTGQQVVEAAGQGDGQLIGVANPVAAGKTVTFEQLVKAEALQAAIKVRDMVLVGIGVGPGIVQPGLQGLVVGNIKNTGAAIKVEPVVPFEHGYRPVKAAVAASVVVQIVTGIVQTNRGSAEPPQCPHRQRQLWDNPHTLAVGPVQPRQVGIIAIEPGVLAFEVGFKQAGSGSA